MIKQQGCLRTCEALTLHSPVWSVPVFSFHGKDTSCVKQNSHPFMCRANPLVVLNGCYSPNQVLFRDGSSGEPLQTSRDLTNCGLSDLHILDVRSRAFRASTLHLDSIGPLWFGAR